MSTENVTESASKNCAPLLAVHRMDLLLGPGLPGEENQNGENLQTACQHGKGQHQLAQIAECAEITGGTYGFKSGTYVVKGAKHGRKICADGEAVHRNDQEDRKNDHHIGSKVSIGVFQYLLIHSGAVVADHLHLPGGEHFADVPAKSLQQQKQSGNLQTAAGGTSAGTHYHQTKENGFGETGMVGDSGLETC